MPRAYSYSQLRQYEECPLAWKLAKIDKVKEEPNRAMLLGGFAHPVIAEYITRCHKAGLPSDAAIIDECIEAARRDRAPIPASMKGEIRTMLDKFATSFSVTMRAPRVEEQLAFDVNWQPVQWFGKDVRFRAIMDLFHEPAAELAQITDFKTGWKVDGEGADSLQLRTYGFIATLLRPSVRVVRASLFHVRYGYEQSHEYHAEDLAGVRDELEQRMAEIDAETKFEATPGDHCQRCSFRRRCPAYQASGRTSEIPEDPRRLAQEFALAKARVKELEAAVKARVDAEGTIDLGRGRVLGYTASERWSNTNPQGLITSMISNGVPKDGIWREIGLSKTAVGKLLKAAGLKDRLDELLDEYGERQTITSLREHKAGEKGGDE